MGDKPQINVERVADFVRQQMSEGENAEDFEEGQEMLARMKAVGRLPSAGLRTIKGLSPGMFDGNNALKDVKGSLGVLQDKRNQQLRKKK